MTFTRSSSRSMMLAYIFMLPFESAILYTVTTYFKIHIKWCNAAVQVESQSLNCYVVIVDEIRVIFFRLCKKLRNEINPVFYHILNLVTCKIFVIIVYRATMCVARFYVYICMWGR
ncbi:hypothetical protein ACP275_02G071900 [Erythranthe tilingii]